MILKNIDILKYLMSIMIHIGYSYEIPVLRSAVPVFFIISSYLFFQKINYSTDKKINVLCRFIKRALKLYAFWFFALLPITIVVRGWYQMQIIEIIEAIFTGVLFKSTFPASWYISAYIIGISIIFFSRKRFKLAVVLSFIVYIVCCLSSNYYYVFVNPLFAPPELILNYNIYNSFPVGLLFICMGKYFAYKEYKSIWSGTSLCIVGLGLLLLENYLICKYNWRKADDCYIGLILLAPGIFMLFNSIIPALVKFDTKNIRKYSTIYYCSHISIITILGALFGEFTKFILLLLVILICTILSFILVRISSKSKFKWIRYSY